MIRFWVGFKGFGYEEWKSVNFLDFVPHVRGRTPWVDGEKEVGRKFFFFFVFHFFFPFLRDIRVGEEHQAKTKMGHFFSL